MVMDHRSIRGRFEGKSEQRMSRQGIRTIKKADVIVRLLTANIMAKLKLAIAIANVKTQPTITGRQRLFYTEAMVVPDDESLLCINMDASSILGRWGRRGFGLIESNGVGGVL